MRHCIIFFVLLGLSVAHAQNVTLNPWSMSAPQMTNAQIMAIPNPQPGWMVFDTDTQCLRLYTNSASNPGWQCLGTVTQPGTTGWQVSGYNPVFNDMVATATALYLVGSYSVANNGIPASAGMRDVFVAKYNHAGTLLWFSRAGSTQMDEGTGIDVVGNEIFISGNFNGTATFGSTSIASAGGQDGFVAKLDDTGAWQWATAVGGAGTDEAKAVVRRKISTGVYGATICGAFNGTANFGSNSFTSAGATDAFTAHTDANGSIAAAFAYGGTGADVANDIFQGETINTSIIVGSFEQTMTVGALTLTSAGGKDGFMIGRWNNNITSYLCKSFGGTDDDEALKIVGTEKSAFMIVAGTIHIMGTFKSTATFPTNTGSTTVTSAGGRDIFDYTGQFNNVINWFSLSPKVAGGSGDETLTALSESSVLNGGGYQSVVFGGTTSAGMIYGSTVIPAGPFVANWGVANQGSWVVSGTNSPVGALGYNGTAIFGAVNGGGTYGNANLLSPGVIKLF
jgi:hypothetical protein